nr:MULTISPECIES: hypothetical protein [unclassified Arthrobacter]
MRIKQRGPFLSECLVLSRCELLSGLGATIDQDIDPGQVAGCFTGAERENSRDILGLAESLDGCRLDEVAGPVVDAGSGK